jgi:hypothetical protein
MGARNHSLSGVRRRAAAILWAEALVLAVAPAGAILLAYAAAALLGLGGAWMFAAVALLAALALGYGALGFQAPGTAQIERRIEAASGLKHRPLAAARDVPETETPLALALWARHQQRIAASLAQARSGGPNFRAAIRDPFALRGFLLLLLLTGIVVAGPAAPSRLAAAFVLPAWPFTGPRVNAWITPPAYDAAPPLMLTPGQPATALAGSQLTVIVNGPRDAPFIGLAGAGFTETALGESSHRADAVLSASGRLEIGPWWHRMGAWNLTVVPPAAPKISLTSFQMHDETHIWLDWHATDPYGLTQLGATLRPDGYPRALPEKFGLSPDASSARLDVSATPYGGLVMGIALNALNAAGVAGQASAWGLRLPPAPLHDRTALRLAALRQRLALEPGTLAGSGAAAAGIAAAPPSAISFGVDVQLAALASAMRSGEIGAQDAVDRLGTLVTEIEAGPDFAPQRALAQANQALMRALQQGLQGRQSSADDLRKLLQAMHEALARHLAAIDPQTAPGAGGRQLDLSALDRLAQKIAADEAAGRTDAAAQELRELQAALNALQSAQPMTAAQAAQAQAAAQGAQALAQLTAGEANLLDNTNRGTATPGAQGALSQALTQTEQALRQAGFSIPGLGQAGQAMAAAQRALTQQNDGQAEGAETAAIQDLQKAAAALAAAAPKTFSLSDGMQGLGEDPSGEGVNGLPDEQSEPGLGVPAANPADAIQQQIMKQDADPNLPAATHQYFHRLLDPSGSGY